MPPLPKGVRYVIVSPVKDEEQYVEKTLRATIRQTVKPSHWVIVDDGSHDQTPEILDRYTRSHPWIRVLRINRDAIRQLGSAEIRAFQAGYQLVSAEDFDFIVKLDCDLDFAPDYFEQLIRKFNEDENLGIASGIYLENHLGEWHPVPMPAYHAAGASKMVRKQCFQDMGGFVLFPGWDTVDEIKAQARGWKTRHFATLQFRHLKNEGSASGAASTSLLHGEVCYVTGAGKIWVLLKALHRMATGRPFIWGGLIMIWGYVRAWITRQPLLVSDDEARFYRRLLNRRLLEALGKFLGLKSKNEVWSSS